MVYGLFMLTRLGWLNEVGSIRFASLGLFVSIRSLWFARSGRFIRVHSFGLTHSLSVVWIVVCFALFVRIFPISKMILIVNNPKNIYGENQGHL